MVEIVFFFEHKLFLDCFCFQKSMTAKIKFFLFEANYFFPCVQYLDEFEWNYELETELLIKSLC